VNVVVVGSANQDYVIRLDHFPRDSETVIAQAIRKQTGGQGANQSVAASRLGARVTFIGCIGDDQDGSLVLQELISEGVDTGEVEVVSSKPTGLAIVSIYPDDNRSIVVVPGANATLGASRVSRAVHRLAGEGMIVLVQGEVATDVVSAVVTSAHLTGARAMVNLAPYRAMTDDLVSLCDPLVMNEIEASSMLGREITGVDEALAAVKSLARVARSAVISIGSEGAVWAEGGESGHAPAAVTVVVDPSGAGDAFVGALAAMLAMGEPLSAAVAIAVAAGAFVVGRAGVQSSFPMRADLLPASAAFPDDEIAVED
jgi:ribokinase